MRAANDDAENAIALGLNANAVARNVCGGTLALGADASDKLAVAADSVAVAGAVVDDDDGD